MREGVSGKETGTNYLKGGGTQATWVSGKKATEEQTAHANASGRNMCGMLATPNESQHTCHQVNKGKGIRRQTGNGLGQIRQDFAGHGETAAFSTNGMKSSEKILIRGMTSC